jgi:hypothetical protein
VRSSAHLMSLVCPTRDQRAMRGHLRRSKAVCVKHSMGSERSLRRWFGTKAEISAQTSIAPLCCAQKCARSPQDPRACCLASGVLLTLDSYQGVAMSTLIDSALAAWFQQGHDEHQLPSCAQVPWAFPEKPRQYVPVANGVILIRATRSLLDTGQAKILISRFFGRTWSNLS